MTRSVAFMFAGAIALTSISLASDQTNADSLPEVPSYDTAWDMPFWADIADADTYFDHVSEAGFTGIWISLFNHTGGGMTAISPGSGYSTARLEQGQFLLDQGHVAHVRRILDSAQARGLKVGLVPIWGVFYINDIGNGCETGSSAGPLKSWNSFSLGQQVGDAFADHPAIAHWILGGDNFCEIEDVAIWRNMAAGLEAGGARQPMTYHTPGLESRLDLFADEPWLDFLSPQTGHCVDPENTQRMLTKLVNSTDKPVWAAELRYEGVQPDWGDCIHWPGNPATAVDIEQDTRAALAAGVEGILFGNNERWQWATGAIGSRGGGSAKVFSTFWSPGEKAFLRAVGGPDVALDVSATADVSVGAPSTIVIRAAGQTGTERIELQIDGQAVGSFDVSTTNASGQLQEFSYIHSGAVTPGRVAVAFINDHENADGSFDRNVKIESISIDEKQYPTIDSSVFSVGAYAMDSGCSPGYKASNWLACPGYFQYSD
ncbi:MAG: DUF4038 domain-containing protein [Acidimicrobiales bacterium]